MAAAYGVASGGSQQQQQQPQRRRRQPLSPPSGRGSPGASPTRVGACGGGEYGGGGQLALDAPTPPHGLMPAAQVRVGITAAAAAAPAAVASTAAAVTAAAAAVSVAAAAAA